jgi:hypothetical protein
MMPLGGASIGRVTRGCILISGAAMIVAVCVGDDTGIMIGILSILWLIAILLGEIITRMDRSERAGEEQHENGER